MAKQQKAWLSRNYYWKQQTRKFGQEGPKLAQDIRKTYAKSVRTWRRSVEYVTDCGGALCEARKFFKPRSPRWKRWLKSEFPEISHESIKVYMRIARKWDDPRVQEYLKGGHNPKTIIGVLRVLNYQKPVPGEKKGRKWDDLSPAEKQRELVADLRRQVRVDQFGEELKKLNRDELEILQEGCDSYSWPRWYRELRNLVVEVTNTPYPKIQYDYNNKPYGDSAEEYQALEQAVRGKKKSRHVRKPLPLRAKP